MICFPPKQVCFPLVTLMATTQYKQALPDLELSIERATDRTPEPAKYYVFHKGEVIGVFPSLKAAQVRYKRIVEESGYKPNRVVERKSAAQLDMDRYLDTKETYWATSYKHRGGGGKGGRGGV